MTPVEWTRAAKADLAAIDEEIAPNDPDFADLAGRMALAAARFLSEWPGSGTPVSETDVRKWPVRRTPYILLYRLAGGRIQILRVQHERQNWRGG